MAHTAELAVGSGSRWVALAVLTFARTAMGFQFQSVGAVSPLLMERLHIGNTELGWLIGIFLGLFYTWYYVGMALLPPVAGRLQDVLGRSAALYFAAAAVLAALPFYVAFRALSAAREGPSEGAKRPGVQPR